VGRREFLTVLGAVSIATVFAAGSALKGEDGVSTAAADSGADDATDSADAVAGQPVIVEYYTPEADAAPTAAPTAAPDTAATSTADSQAQPVVETATAEPATPTAAPEPTAVPEPTATAQSEPTAEDAAVACTVRCNKGCSFPGRCRRYRDTNNNDRCDLGECL
jgi:FtsZ-interacting cell division protein ZipA